MYAVEISSDREALPPSTRCLAMPSAAADA